MDCTLTHSYSHFFTFCLLHFSSIHIHFTDNYFSWKWQFRMHSGFFFVFSVYLIGIGPKQNVMSRDTKKNLLNVHVMNNELKKSTWLRPELRSQFCMRFINVMYVWAPCTRVKHIRLFEMCIFIPDDCSLQWIEFNEY